MGRSSGYLDDMSTLRSLYDVHFSQACLLLVSSTKILIYLIQILYLAFTNPG